MNNSANIEETSLVLPGLYIHIPFCLTKCHYCNFYSETSQKHLSSYSKALESEMALYEQRFRKFDTVYFGGGTPSILKADEIEDILRSIERYFSLSEDSEITIEANPGDLDPDFLRSLRERGVNRLNIGVQSFDDDILDFLGRRHSSREAARAIENTHKEGFTNIGLDLIYGIPGQNMKKWMDTLARAISFKPEHISCYQLTIEASTHLGKRLGNGEISLPDEDLQFDFFIKTSEMLEDEGYIHYEISNFARETRFISRHNSKYWNHTPYLGLGPSAHSFFKSTRWWNHSSTGRYLEDIKEGKPPVENTESLDMKSLRMEALFLGLRTAKGINLQDFNNRFDYDLMAEKGNMLAKLEGSGLIEIADGYVVPTRRGFALADSLALI
jgi:oxygen-independent coproporphyrinogen-3 oxidase